MNAMMPIATPDTPTQAMRSLLARQKAAFLRDGPPSLATRAHASTG